MVRRSHCRRSALKVCTTHQTASRGKQRDKLEEPKVSIDATRSQMRLARERGSPTHGAAANLLADPASSDGIHESVSSVFWQCASIRSETLGLVRTRADSPVLAAYAEIHGVRDDEQGSGRVKS